MQIPSRGTVFNAILVSGVLVSFLACSTATSKKGVGDSPSVQQDSVVFQATPTDSVRDLGLWSYIWWVIKNSGKDN